MFQIHAFADGRVQGVNFRNYVQRKAYELALTGYVRNLPDDKVEIMAQGSQENLEKLIAYMKSNPGISLVTDLDVDWEEPKGKFNGFRIRF
jgi:acylphosphatase